MHSRDAGKEILYHPNTLKQIRNPPKFSVAVKTARNVYVGVDLQTLHGLKLEGIAVKSESDFVKAKRNLITAVKRVADMTIN